jgi:hypothetical protein
MPPKSTVPVWLICLHAWENSRWAGEFYKELSGHFNFYFRSDHFMITNIKKWRNSVFLLVQLQKSWKEHCTHLYSCCWVHPAEYKENNSYFLEKEQVGTVKTDSIKHYKIYCVSSSTVPTRYNLCPVHSRSDFVQVMKWLIYTINYTSFISSMGTKSPQPPPSSCP